MDVFAGLTPPKVDLEIQDEKTRAAITSICKFLSDVIIKSKQYQDFNSGDATASQAIAEAGTDNTQFITALGVKQEVQHPGTVLIPIENGGTNQVTAQAAINALLDAENADGESVATKDTSTGNIVMKVPADMVVTAAPSTDKLASGLKIVLTAGQDTAFGDVCYIASNGKATLIDADAIASMTGIVMCADNSIASDGSGNWLLIGIARNDAWSWTVGGIIYGTVTGTSGNTLSQTAPTGASDVIQIMGVATHADRMYFNPSLSQVEHV